ncbi:hypothetical protein GCM10010232_38810 [Streptomyces amakusaensis]|uniref:Polyprenyl synthetase n=1 Tax=Streptomyces amakusaensis TaxID=67271 RepID=A0ABW0APB1_9ACTN
MAEEHTVGQVGGRRADEAVLLAAGVADLVLEQAESALRRVRGLLGRSDLSELAADARRDLLARGRNSGLDTSAFAPQEAHLELLARRAKARVRGEDARAGDAEPGREAG